MRGRMTFGAAVCAALVSGCVDESTQDRVDVADTSDTLAIDTSDTTSTSDVPDGEPGRPAIVSFAVDFATITHGDDRDGALVAGAATLSWRTDNAADIRILVDGVAIALDDCLPSGSGPCAAAGGLVVRPSEATSFTLEARGPDGVCAGPCPTAMVEVAVAEPAIITLETATPIVSAGADATFAYSAQGATWAIGLAGFDEEGMRTFEPCVPASEADASAPCAIADDGAGNPLDVGLVVATAVERDLTFAAVATNGADDGLGDIALGDVLLGITVPVEVATFTATPKQVLPGGDVVLAWEVHGAHTIEVTTASESVTGLSTCIGLGLDGKGFCTVGIDVDADLGAVAFELVGTQDTGSRGQARADITIIGGPTITRFESSAAVLVPGQSATLDWTAYGAETVTLTAVPDVIEGDCDGLGPDGHGSCTITVSPGASAGAVALTLTASHGAIGPPGVRVLNLDVLAAPRVTAFEVDDDTVLASARITLTWKTADATIVVLGDDSGTIAPAALASCSSVSGLDGMGTCVLQIPAGLEPGIIGLTLRAVGPTGARSEPATLDVTLGRRPEATLTASPLTLPEGGGEVTLNWTAVTATQVVVTDDADVPNTIVDTDAGTSCGDASPCAPAGDSITLTAVQSSVYTLMATNDFGTSIATARITIEGAPVIAALSFDGDDARGTSVLVDATSAALVWAVEAITPSDELRLERAPLPTPGGSCDAVAGSAWTLVAGFPMDGATTGSVQVEGLTAIAECFRFTAEDLDSTPTQRASATFKVKKSPSVTALTVNDNTMQPGDVVTLTWASANAYGVVVTATPIGAVTSQELAGCGAASGSCAVTIQPGTPLGDVTLMLFAYGEEGASSATSSVAVTVGVGAKLISFTASPGSASSAVDVELAWASSDGGALVISDGTATALSTSEAAVIAGGTLSARATATTTWTLTVTNAFGSATGQVTVFIGPSIDALAANGGNALDGSESVETGPVTIAWTTTSASGSHRLQTVKAPANGNCAAANLAWVTVYEDLASPAASASHSLGTVVENLCVRLVVTNTEAPPQTSTSTFLLRELPVIASFATSPSSIAASGGTVIVDMGVRGAGALTLTAQYRAASGEVLGTRSVCTQASLNNGSLTGSAAIDDVECAHTIVACNLLCLNNGMPAATKSVRYVLAVSDAEADAANATTAGGEDVTVP